MIPQVLFPILSYSLLATIETSISVLIPITYTTSVASGGLGLTSFQLGSILGMVTSNQYRTLMIRAVM